MRTCVANFVKIKTQITVKQVQLNHLGKNKRESETEDVKVHWVNASDILIFFYFNGGVNSY